MHRARACVHGRNRACVHGRTQLAAAKLFVSFCIVRGFEDEDSLENLHSVLFCLIKKRSL